MSGPGAGRYRRQKNEAYFTPPYGVRPLIDMLPLVTLTKFTVWECAAGAGHVAREFVPFCDVIATDIAPAGNQVFPVKELNFLDTREAPCKGPLAIITNPPYGKNNALALAFLRHALQIARERRGLVCLLLPFEFDAAGSRDDLVGAHPAFAAKITCATRLRWINIEQKEAGPMKHHSWFVYAFDKALRRRLRAQPMRTI